MAPEKTSLFQAEDKSKFARPERSMSHAVRFFDISSQLKSEATKKEEEPVNIGEVVIKMESDS